MHYLVYLDEFGHIGPYVAANDPSYKTHPVFGIGGVAIPVEEVRSFSTFFFQLKNRLLAWELENKANGIHPAKWEKKGSQLYTIENVEKYRELRQATFRIFNYLRKINAFVIYVGLEKRRDVENHNANKIYQSVFKELIKRLDQEFIENGASFQLLLDESENKNYERLIETAALQMFGSEPKRTLIEPPVQLKSHLYQNMQAADWICAIIGRLTQYEFEPIAFDKNLKTVNYFQARLQSISRRSSIRRINS